MNQARHQEQLAGIARWCLAQRAGILTPTGRKKKPPTYMILRCEEHGLILNDSKMTKATRDLCSAMNLTKEKTKSTSRPRSEICLKPTVLIEEIS